MYKRIIGKPAPRLRWVVLGLSLCESIAMGDHDTEAIAPSLQPAWYEY